MTLTPTITEPPSAVGPLASRAKGVFPYATTPRRAAADLHLDANEGPSSGLDLAAALRTVDADALRRYPSTADLERLIADRWRVDPDRVLVTAGGDDAIDRLCRACLEPGRELIFPSPSFEMIERNARLAGASVLRVPWPEGGFPMESVQQRLSAATAMIAIVSPNNPTGAVATADDLRQLARIAPGATLMVDLAYAEFAGAAGEELMAEALATPRAVAIRTFSKAFGLAGLRVGYAIGPAEVIRAMRAMGGPYPVSSLSVAIAADQFLHAGRRVAESVASIGEERRRLASLLTRLGAAPAPSQANFVLCEVPNAAWTWSALTSLGIAVRRFGAGSDPRLQRSLRITCPGDDGGYARLESALTAALRPEALLFDLDGVLADVSNSYRRAIALTAQSFGVSLNAAEIADAKASGNANNDWALTRRLLEARGVRASLAEVTERFEGFYQGSLSAPGLKASERLIPSPQLLQRLASRLPLGVVTGRPRRDAEEFLSRFGVAELFRTLVCMEDAPAKPDPAPVRRALAELSVAAAWLVGDTPDDLWAARAAGVVPLGIVAPSAEPSPEATSILSSAGAAVVLPSLDTLEELLP